MTREIARVAGHARILLVGAGGQLGRDLARALARPGLVALGREALDVTDAAAVERAVAAATPEVVVNATAFNRVDDAETDPRPAFAVNALGVHALARSASRYGARLVHFSTDYVFGGGEPGPYAEDAMPAPVNAYGVSKLAGERLALATAPRNLVIRTSGLYGLAGSRGKGGNFVEAMLQQARNGKAIRVVSDQVLGPTYTTDVARAVARLVAADPAGGIYHLTNGGACSWFEFAQRIFALCRLEPDLAPITSEAGGAAARRPANSVLENRRIVEMGLPRLRSWDAALADYLAARGHLRP